VKLVSRVKVEPRYLSRYSDRLRTGLQRDGVSIPAAGEISVSISQRLIPWVPGSLLPAGKGARVMNLNTYLYLVSRLKMS
jgi:hypothetical protein